MDQETKTFTKQTIHRPDGRQAGGKLRPLSAEVSSLSRADGSCKYSAGSTQLLAAIYGPAPPRIAARERTTEATVAVVFKHGAKNPGGTAIERVAPPAYGATEREVERFISDALTSCIMVTEYPRTIIEVVIQVIKADGSVVGTALNAAVLALMDAGIRMKSLSVATTCMVPMNATSKNFKDGDILFDPTSEEESKEDYSVVVLATDSVQEGVIASMTFGSFQLVPFLSCIEGASRAGKAITAFARIAMEQKATREAKTLWSI